MLLPFQMGVITVEEARLLMTFIETSTATKGQSRNYDKMQKAGVLEIYNKLRELVEFHDHYEGQIRYLDTYDLVREGDLDQNRY